MKTHRGIDRRRFLEGMGGAAVALRAFRPERVFASQDEADFAAHERSKAGFARKRRSLELRQESAIEEFRVPIPEHRNNGDELRYQNRIGNFSKGSKPDGCHPPRICSTCLKTSSCFTSPATVSNELFGQ